MILLVDNASVQNRMGLPAVPEANKTLGSAIAAAHLRVQSILDTSFAHGSQVDDFLLNRDMLQGKVPNGFFRLRLRYGLLLSTPVVSVQAATTLADLDTVPETVTGYKIDYKRGYVFVPANYENDYVRVSYEYGFEKSASGKITPTPPEELVEGIVSYVPSVLEFSVKTSSVGTKVADQNKRLTAADHSFSVLTPLMRRMGFSLDPIY